MSLAARPPAPIDSIVTVSLGGVAPEPATTCRGTIEKSANAPAELRMKFRLVMATEIVSNATRRCILNTLCFYQGFHGLFTNAGKVMRPPRRAFPYCAGMSWTPVMAAAPLPPRFVNWIATFFSVMPRNWT